jgi:hypothetical protein
MAKIISGGYAFENDALPNKQEYSAPVNQKVAQQETPESWGQYGVRNLAQVPASLYETARSGLGGGNLLKMLTDRVPEGIFQAGQLDKLRRVLLPTTSEANEELSTFLPKTMTEHKPEDYWTQFALTQAPFLAAGGAFKSAPAFAKSLTSTLGMLGGSELGSAAGGAIGNALGDEELGATLGGFAGGAAGGHGVNKAITLAKNRPSKYFPEKIQGKLQSDIVEYRNKINTLDTQRTENYKKAKGLESAKKGSAKPLRKQINEIYSEMEGVHPTDKKLIRENIRELDNSLASGELSLTSAKRIQKNFNDQIYNRDASRTFKRYMGEITNTLNKFIEEVGGEEHSKPWKEAEAQTRELKKLQRNEKDFIREKKIEMRENKAHFEPETSVANKWGLAGLASVLGNAVGGHKIGAIVGGLTKAGQTLAEEIKFSREVMRNHPEIHQEFKTFIKEADKLPKAEVLRRLDILGNNIKQAQEKDNEKEYKKKSGKIISGGMIL